MVDKVGIGISFGLTANGDVYVTALAPNGSAETSGLINVGDRILAVDGAEVTGLAVPDVVKLIVGQPNTLLKLDVLSRVPERKTDASSASQASPSPSAEIDVDFVERKYKVRRHIPTRPPVLPPVQPVLLCCRRVISHRCPAPPLPSPSTIAATTTPPHHLRPDQPGPLPRSPPC